MFVDVFTFWYTTRCNVQAKHRRRVACAVVITQDSDGLFSAKYSWLSALSIACEGLLCASDFAPLWPYTWSSVPPLAVKCDDCNASRDQHAIQRLMVDDWLTSWMRVPPRESVPVLGAFQKAPQRVT